jgi:hypothetical protein
MQCFLVVHVTIQADTRPTWAPPPQSSLDAESNNDSTLVIRWSFQSGLKAISGPPGCTAGRFFLWARLSSVERRNDAHSSKSHQIRRRLAVPTKNNGVIELADRRFG